MSSSIRNNWFHLASRDERVTEPTLICRAPQPTARSASSESSVSPDLAETTLRQRTYRARRTTRSASVNVPTWLTLTSTALAADS